MTSDILRPVTFLFGSTPHTSQINQVRSPAGFRFFLFKPARSPRMRTCDLCQNAGPSNSGVEQRALALSWIALQQDFLSRTQDLPCFKSPSCFGGCLGSSLLASSHTQGAASSGTVVPPEGGTPSMRLAGEGHARDSKPDQVNARCSLSYA